MYLERKLKRKKIKRILIVVIPILILLIGSSFAFFTFYKTNEAFILTMKGVPMQVEFKEGDNVIDVPLAYPISDEYAKENLSKLNYVDFTVRGGTPNNEYLYYELYLTEEDGNTLDSNYIKVYLTDENNQKVVEPSIYNNLSQSTSDNKNGKILYNESLTGIFEKNYRLYVWIDKDYTQNKVNQTFLFKVNLYAYNGLGSATNVIKSKLVKYEISNKEDFLGGLVAVNTEGELYNETDETEEIREYRYSGPNVNNYVTFNDETWRIIGVFKEDGKELIKITRNNLLESEKVPTTFKKNDAIFTLNTEKDKRIYLNKTDTLKTPSNNDWSNGGVNFYLNSIEDESDNKEKGYLSYLSADSKKMINNTTFHLGNVKYKYLGGTTPELSENTIEAYLHERDETICPDNINNDTYNNNCYIWSGSQTSIKQDVALLYPSDFGYSATSKFWNLSLAMGIYDKSDSKNNNWMCNTFTDSVATWLINASGAGRNSSINFVANCRLGVNNTDTFAAGVRPTLYLKSNVKIISGDGTQDNQYKLSID